MNSHDGKASTNKSTAAANHIVERRTSTSLTSQFEDNRQETVMQRKLQEMADNNQKINKSVAQQFANPAPVIQRDDGDDADIEDNDEPDPFFCRAHLEFITQGEEGRLPTLYFDDGFSQGRLRQEHAKGAKAQQGVKKVRMFVPPAEDHNLATLSEFIALPEAVKRPTAGTKLIEWYVVGKNLRNKHRSAGIVSTTLDDYTNEVINAIVTGIA